jgi:hypothetical protein
MTPGTSIILSDGTPPNIRDKGTLVDFIEIWNTPTVPAIITATEPEPTDGELITPPPMGAPRSASTISSLAISTGCRRVPTGATR